MIHAFWESGQVRPAFSARQQPARHDTISDNVAHHTIPAAKMGGEHGPAVACEPYGHRASASLCERRAKGTGEHEPNVSAN